jgi:Ca-activated chloride channel family protein
VSLAAPQYLLALIAVPIMATVYFVFESRRARRSTAWSRPQLQPNIVTRPSRRLGLVPPVLFLAGLALLVVGFARPQRANSSNGRVIGPTIVLAFDVSGSMAARDIQPTRLRAARELATRFLNRLPSNYEVAVLTFGNKVHLTVPPTFDHADVIAHLPKAVTPLSGTSIGDGISAAVSLIIQAIPQGVPVDRLHPAGSVVVFSDGAQTGGGTEPADAGSTAFVYAIPINSVIVGTSHGAVTQPLKVDVFRTSIQIAVPALPLDLQRVSQLTGGTTLEATSAADLNAAATKLPGVIKGENLSAITRTTPGKHELSAAAGMAGLAFVLGGILLSGLWFGRLA